MDPCCPHLEWVFSPQVTRSRKSLTDPPRDDPLVIFCCVELTILTITASLPRGTFWLTFTVPSRCDGVSSTRPLNPAVQMWVSATRLSWPSVSTDHSERQSAGIFYTYGLRLSESEELAFGTKTAAWTVDSRTC